MTNIDELEKRISALETEVTLLKNSIKPENDTQETSTENHALKISVPGKIIDKINGLDERQRFPILWYFSNKSNMRIDHFMNACADTGFSLQPSWLPSAGGNFKNRLVKEDKLFRQSKEKIEGKKTWEFTDTGKFKIRKVVDELLKND